MKIARTPTILLVEDNRDDEDLALRALKTNNVGASVVVARDGVEALDWLFCRNAHAARDPLDAPAVVLLDLKLPRLDGLEVLKCIRATTVTRHVPVVVLTTSKEDSDLLASYSLGANSYIRKPVDFLKFVDAVRQLGIYWLTLNEFPPPLVERR